MQLDEGLLRGAEVLVVDDEPAHVARIEQLLERNGFTRIRSTTDPRRLRPMFLELRPDIVLLDLHMPHADGLELLREIGELRAAEEYLPVLVLSADVTSKACVDALGAGALDFSTTPFDTTEVGRRVLNYLEARRLHLQLAEHQRKLDDHERWNAEGYPAGLATTDIPLPGRVVAVCDVFDALIHERPSEPAWSLQEAVDEPVAQRGEFFDPDLVDVFVADVLPGLRWLTKDQRVHDVPPVVDPRSKNGNRR